MRKRLCNVLRLNFPDVIDVSRIKELSTEDHQSELCFGVENLGDSVGFLTRPARPCDHIASSIVASGAAPDIPVVERIHVSKLH